MTDKNEDNELWIRRFNPRDESKLRLVCLPHAGGSASFYHPMASAVPLPVDVLAVQYPGRQDRRTEPGITSIQALADEVTEALEPWTDQPLALFGHSMGATLAFEVARRLESRHGVVPAALFASGRRAPSRPRNESVHRLGDDGLIAELKALSGTDSQVLGDEEVLRMVLPAIRTDYRAAETYVYEPGEKLHCPVIGLVGDGDPKVTVGEARSWGDHTEGPFNFHTFGGGHFYLLNHRTEIIKIISDHLLGACVD
ncbi:thioesterase II family protein [Streptomyces lydicus]|uniref:thioesterase II family protein n=1 Tax=Streptomyces lydicus TaxID=47763 RepID=UPI0010135898|nr:alpha/beta fold hydrolase [Streptomyces lydicus]